MKAGTGTRRTVGRHVDRPPGENAPQATGGGNPAKRGTHAGHGCRDGCPVGRPFPCRREDPANHGPGRTTGTATGAAGIGTGEHPPGRPRACKAVAVRPAAAPRNARHGSGHGHHGRNLSADRTGGTRRRDPVGGCVRHSRADAGQAETIEPDRMPGRIHGGHLSRIRRTVGRAGSADGAGRVQGRERGRNVSAEDPAGGEREKALRVVSGTTKSFQHYTYTTLTRLFTPFHAFSRLAKRKRRKCAAPLILLGFIEVLNGRTDEI